MALHDKRHRRSLVFASGIFAAGLSISCTGSIMDGPGDDGSNFPGPGPSGNGGDSSTVVPGGMVPPGKEILPTPPNSPACETREFTPARVWRLSDDQYVNAVKDLLPGTNVPTILTPGRSAQQFIDFAELFEIGPAIASDIRASVTAAAADAVKNLDGLLGCKGGEDANACAERFIEGFASRAFRRPLDDADKTGLKAVYAEGAKVNRGEGVRMAMTAVLQSASFLYRTELGRGNVGAGQTVELTSHELASSLSFLLLNSIPDAELRAAADDGSLTKPDKFKAQVERLLKLPRVQDHLTTVYLKWMGLGMGLNTDLAMQEKEFTPELKAGLEQEVKLFFKDLLTNGGTISDLLTSNKGFTDKALASHFGMNAPASGVSSVNYPAAERAGVLTLAGILARYSVGHAEVFRGKFVRDEFLCQEIPPPPNVPEVEDLTESSKNLPAREQVELRLNHPICGNCHKQMDPIGLSLGNYDALGRFKTTEKDGKPIDSKGELTGAGDVDGPLKNGVDLAQRLAKSPVVRSCIESKMLGYALGRLTGDIDQCEMKKIDSFVTAGGGKLSDLMAAVVYSSAFRYRSGEK